jgi:hypothetical protein
MDNLDRKKWQQSKQCQLYNEEEKNVDHLIFRCPIAIFVWVVVRDGLEWSESPRCVQDFEEKFLSKLGPEKLNVMWILFGAIVWTLWLNRNDFVFNNSMISSPALSFSDFFLFCSIG